MSRWHNYYIEGLNWLAKNVGIDGLYIDDVAFDRTTMKRVRKVLDRNRPGALIDLHSANQYNPRDGFASSANLYLEHFPYPQPALVRRILRLQTRPPDYLARRDLRDSLRADGRDAPGRRESLARHDLRHDQPPALVGQDPARLWKVWDDFGIGDAEMIGYWVDECPSGRDRPRTSWPPFTSRKEKRSSRRQLGQGPGQVGSTSIGNRWGSIR